MKTRLSKITAALLLAAVFLFQSLPAASAGDIPAAPESAAPVAQFLSGQPDIPSQPDDPTGFSSGEAPDPGDREDPSSPETDPGSEDTSPAPDDSTTPSQPSNPAPTSSGSEETGTGEGEEQGGTDTSTSVKTPAASDGSTAVDGQEPTTHPTESLPGFTTQHPSNDLIDAVLPDGEGDPDNIKDILEYLGYDPPTIFSEISLTFKDPSGATVTEPTPDDFFYLSFLFEIPDDLWEYLTGGQYYDVTLDDRLSIDGFPANGIPVNITLPDGSEVEIGRVTLNDDGSLRITFDDTVQNYSDITGGIVIDGQLDEQALGNPGDTTITVPSEDWYQGTEVTVRPSVSVSIDKDGEFDRLYNPNSITWTVNANKGMQTLNNFTITEALPDNVTLTSAQVYTYRVDFNGDPIEGSETLVDPSEYTLDPVTGDIVFINEVSTPIRVVYQTEINEDAIPNAEGGNLTFENTVTMGSDEVEAGSPGTIASDSLVGNWSARIAKTNTSYDPATQTWVWRIEYNWDEAEIAPGTTITDTLPENMVYEPDSFLINYVTLNDNGTATIGGPVDEADYAFGYDPDTGEITITFPNGLTGPIIIEYQTYYDGILDENSVFYNTATDGDNSSTGQGPGQQQNIIKRVVGVDVNTQLITWEIEVNRNNYLMYGWSMSDDFLGMEFAYDLSIRDISTNPTTTLTGALFPEMEDYQYRVNDPGLFISFGQEGDPYYVTNHTFLITFSTHYDPTNIPGDGDSLINHATGTWTDENGNSHTSDDDASYTPTTEETNNGSKSGSYNATTKEITWTVRVNYANTGLLNATLTDPIGEGENFIPGSVRIYYYTITANGTPIRGAELTPAEYSQFTIAEPSVANNQTLRINIPDTSEEEVQYWFEFKTSLEDELISKRYYNTAVLHNDYSDEDMNLSASVSVANGGSYSGKQGQLETDDDGNSFVWWTVTVNPSQSTMENVLVTDVHSANQLIDLSTLQVLGTNVAANGNISINENEVLTEGSDYTYTYAQNEAGDWELDLRFLNEIDTAYIIRYRVIVLVDGSAPTVNLTNNASVTGEHEETVTGGSNGNITVNVGGGDGWAVGTLGQVTIRKTDSVTGLPLPGVTFQLYFDAAMTRPAGGTATTGPDGLITYESLPYGTYYLYEVEWPDGYSPQNPNPRALVVNAATSSATAAPTNVPNAPSAVSLQKRASNNTSLGLQGATFSLYQLNEATNSYERIRANETFVTDANGNLTIYGLPAGLYYLQETAAPTGYKPDYDTVYPFTIAANGAGYLTVSYGFTNPVLNAPTYVEITKYDDTETTLLAGAEFMLEVQNPTTGAWSEPFPGERYTTGSDGKIRFTALPVGTYRITETRAPEGYARHTIPLVFTIEETGEGTAATIQDVYDTFLNYPTIVAMYKVDVETRALLAGAVYELYQEIDGVYTRIREDETFYTDDTGLLELHLLELDINYRLVEVQAPPGYSLDSTPIDFTVDETYYGQPWPDIQFLPDHENIPSQVYLQKVEPVDGEDQPLAGAVFRLDRQNPATGEWETLLPEERPVDANGSLTVDALPIGHYRFVEIEAPDGYLLDTEPVEFDIEADEEGVLLNVALTVENAPNVIQLLKHDENAEPLAGAEFYLFLLDGDTGSYVRIREEEQLITDNDGLITVEGLLPGTYRFVEMFAPDGYQLLTMGVQFTVTGAETDAILLGPVENELTHIQLPKVDETGGPVAGAEFALFMLNEDETEYEPIRTEEQLVTDEDGMLVLLGLAPGSYRLIEINAAPGFLLDDTPIDFQILPGLFAPVELPAFVNLFNGATLIKVDDDENRLAGAIFRLEQYNASEEEWITVQTEVPLTSDENGLVTLQNLEPGTYRLIETAAPTGYDLDDTPIEFEVEENTTEGFLIGTHENPVTPEKPTPTTPVRKPARGATSSAMRRTGDNSNVAFWLAIAGIAVLVTAGILTYAYRRKRRGSGKK